MSGWLGVGSVISIDVYHVTKSAMSRLEHVLWTGLQHTLKCPTSTLPVNAISTLAGTRLRTVLPQPAGYGETLPPEAAVAIANTLEQLAMYVFEVGFPWRASKWNVVPAYVTQNFEGVYNGVGMVASELREMARVGTQTLPSPSAMNLMRWMMAFGTQLEPVAATAPPNGFFDFNIHLLKWTQLVQDQLERIPQIRVELGTVGG